MEEDVMVMLSEHFSLMELTRTNHTDCLNVPGEKETENLRSLARLVLQPLRNAWGDKLRVNSGYRSLLVNTRVRGSRNSYHLRGLAADIDCGGDALKAMQLAIYCKRLSLPVVEAIASKRGQHYWLHVALRLPGDNKPSVFAMKQY